MVGAGVRALLDPPDRPPTFEEARALCLDLTRSNAENFTVVSWLAPKAIHEHLAFLYAYCRTVDDLGDAAPGDRLALLDRFEAELDAVYDGTPRHPVLIALRKTIETFDLPQDPFARLIEANRIDQRTTRHPTFDSLLDYCACSANPVGRLVLMLHGYRDAERFELSDATCTALQLANFWQDVKRDYEMGRVYLPQDEMTEYGVRDEDLAADRASEPLCRLMCFQVERARDSFRRGFPLLARVSGRLRIDLALFSRGGLAVLHKIADQEYDTLFRRPTVSGTEKVGLLLSTLAQPWRTRWT